MFYKIAFFSIVIALIKYISNRKISALHKHKQSEGMVVGLNHDQRDNGGDDNDNSKIGSKNEGIRIKHRSTSRQINPMVSTICDCFDTVKMIFSTVMLPLMFLLFLSQILFWAFNLVFYINTELNYVIPKFESEYKDILADTYLWALRMTEMFILLHAISLRLIITGFLLFFYFYSVSKSVQKRLAELHND